MLLSAEGVGTVDIMRRTGTSKTCVWRWQERFAEAGVEGLLRDKTRSSRACRRSGRRPIKPGRAGTTTHDYNGTNTLFTALNVLDAVSSCPLNSTCNGSFRPSLMRG